MVNKLKKLAIITSYPAQYNAPLFTVLARRKKIEVKVFYTWSQNIDTVVDSGFGKTYKWDIPLFESYSYRVVPNISKDPGTHHRKGLINPDLISLVSSWMPDAVLIFGWNFVSHLKAIKFFYGKIPVLFRGDSTLLDEKASLKTIARRFFLKNVYSYIDYALYVGTCNKKYFLKHGVADRNLIFAPHAIDNKRFADNPENQYQLKAQKIRKELGYSDNDIVILFAGKFEAKKSPDLLIYCINQITKSANHQIIKLLMVGNGVLEQKLHNIAGENKNIKFLPFQNQKQMPVLYRIADILCLPSRGPGETWGLAVNEAMASGKPVIVSDKVGCCEDLVKNGFNGWSFKSDDINSLINTISELIGSKHKLSLMGNNASSFIQKWSYETICNAIEALVNNV